MRHPKHLVTIARHRTRQLIIPTLRWESFSSLTASSSGRTTAASFSHLRFGFKILTYGFVYSFCRALLISTSTSSSLARGSSSRISKVTFLGSAITTPRSPTTFVTSAVNPSLLDVQIYFLVQLPKVISVGFPIAELDQYRGPYLSELGDFGPEDVGAFPFSF